VSRTDLPHPAHPLVFIRHGETDWNVVKRLQGRTDIPLNDTGRGQARRNGAVLREHLRASGHDVEDHVLLASPLGRARETAEIVAATLGVDPVRIRFDERLAEIRFGTWEGHSLAEIEATRPDEFAPRRLAPYTHRPPGGESYADVAERLEGLLSALAGPAILVSHGGVSRALRALLTGIDGPDIATLPVPQDQFFHWHAGEGRWI
jgi:Fructose-2,6-bisphosphatase